MKKFFSIFFLMMCLLFAGCGEDTVIDGYQIEYLNNAKDEIVKVEYAPDSTETSDLIAELLIVLCSDSENVEYRKPIPNDVELIAYSLDGAMLTIWFDEDYKKMTAVEEVLCRAAIVRTMTQIEGVDCVTFYVGGTPLQDAQGNLIGTMYADSFVENPGKQINSIQDATLTLYFSNKDGDGLIVETRNVHYSSNISMEKLIMEQLLKGPEKAGLRSAIPSGTKLVSLSVVDGICYVNLDANFKNQDYTIMEPIVIYSIVNSLSEVSTISKVQISVNGDTSGTYRDTYQMSDMYVRNLDYVTTLSEEETEVTETEGTEETEVIENTELEEETEEPDALERERRGRR